MSNILRLLVSSSGFSHPVHDRVGINGCSPTKSSICEIPQHKQTQTNALSIASLNVGRLRVRPNEVVEMFWRGIDLCCIKECRWRSASARMIKGKDSRCKCFWIDNELRTDVVGALLAEKWIDVKCSM